MDTLARGFDKSAVYTALVEFNDTAVVCKGLDGTILSWNRGAEKLYGYTEDEIVGMPISTIIPDDLMEQEAMILDTIKRGERVEFFTTVRKRRGGELVDISLSVTPVHDADGRIVGAAKIARDISAQRKAERQFEKFVELAPYAMLMVDHDGLMHIVNRQAEMLFGYPRADLLGKPFEMLIPGAQDRLGPEIRHARAASDPPAAADPRREMCAQAADGRQFPVEMRITPVEDDQETTMIVSLIDITERRAAEIQSRRFHQMLEEQVEERTALLNEANRELSDFAYAAAHDLKAPLRVIDNASRWLREDLEGLLNDDMKENMQLLRSRVTRMERFLDDLLEYSRIGQTNDRGFREVVNGRTLIDEVLGMLSLPTGFTVEVSETFSHYRFFRMPLQQIFINLIENAVKHHDRAEGLISLLAELDGNQYVFKIVDDGPGIPEAYHKLVFEKFQTLRPRDQVEGSGMGLAIARKRVTQAGGEIDILPGEGRGSTFRFTWPVDAAEMGAEDAG